MTDIKKNEETNSIISSKLNVFIRNADDCVKLFFMLLFVRNGKFFSSFSPAVS